MDSKTIFFFCYRLLEFRLFLNTGILEKCAKKARIVLIVPPKFVEDVAKLVPDNVIIEPLCYENFKGASGAYGRLDILRNFLHGIFSYIFPLPKGYMRCVSQAFLMDAYWRRCKRQGVKRIFIGLFGLGLAWLASHSMGVRRTLQKLYAFSARNKAHQTLFTKYKPNLVVVGSMGLDADGLALYEAQQNHCRTVVTTQTWDRSTCKGYPPISPDDVIVWSQHMADEVHYYQNIARQNIHIEGAPVWDHIFREDERQDRDVFIKSIGLNPDKPIVYYPMSSDFWHQYTISTVKKLVEERKKGVLQDVQFIFRMHPYYLRNEEKRAELFDAIGNVDENEGIFFDRNETSNVGGGLVLSETDKYFQANCYYNSDLSISVVSTCMVESILCDLPAINMEFGRWETGDKEVDIKDYTLHHLYRIYSYDAIERVRDFGDLISSIRNQLDSKKDRSQQRISLMEGETPINRGSAASSYASRLLNLSDQSHEH